MTKREQQQRSAMYAALQNLGFTYAECESLRRISMTLRRWFELECGDSNEYSSWCITRGTKGPKVDGKREFIHDEAGKPYMERHSHTENQARYYPIPDRETGAKKRLVNIIAARNVRLTGADWMRRQDEFVHSYIQGDPRGAALYILRPGDVPAGQDADAFYNRGICVY